MGRDENGRKRKEWARARARGREKVEGGVERQSARSGEQKCESECGKEQERGIAHVAEVGSRGALAEIET